MSAHPPIVDVIVRLALLAVVSVPHTSCTTAPERASVSPPEPLIVEGFYPLDALTPDFYAAKRISLEGPGVPHGRARRHQLDHSSRTRIRRISIQKAFAPSSHTPGMRSH